MRMSAQNYVVSPTVPDFMDITAPCVVPTYGDFRNPFAKEGIVPSRHRVITEDGTDENTGNKLHYLPPGESKAICLGNDSVGAEAESITYHFIVDPERSVLYLKFAVVMQDPGHDQPHQPRFRVRILNSHGRLIEPCAEYDVTARPDIEGFQSFEALGTPIRWRDWTSVGLDMSLYAGQEVQVQFATFDCEQTAHFGYAYFTATCISNKLAISACTGDAITISAPVGFSSYLWQDGRTETSTRWTLQGESMPVSCLVTSVTGCRFTLGAVIANNPEVPGNPEFYDTICQGEAYRRHNYDLPPQTVPGTTVCFNSYIDIANCGAVGETKLFLTVLQRYFPVRGQICEGDDYSGYGFTYKNPRAGTYLDTLIYDIGRCDSIVALRLEVLPIVTMKRQIVGNTHPCVSSVQQYKMFEDWPAGSFRWTFPTGYVVIDGVQDSVVKVQITDIAEPGEVMLYYGSGGCAFGIEPLVITPQPTYWNSVSDTICTGISYHGYGFNVEAKDTANIYKYVQYGTTVNGCDSTTTLSLHVYPTPHVNILPSDYVVCPGDSMRLDVVAGDAQLVPPDVPMPLVEVGDVYCSDGRITPLEEYTPGSCRAEGIVFKVDATGRHGWIVSMENAMLEDSTTLFQWASGDWLNTAIGGAYYTSWEAQLDTAGYSNTRRMREWYRYYHAYFPIVWAVDFERGWYVPAAGQAAQLFTAINELNIAFRKVTGHPYLTELDGYDRYWTSTWSSSSYAWNLCLWLGYVSVNKREEYFGIRAVRSF